MTPIPTPEEVIELRGQQSLLEPYKRTRKTDPTTSLDAAASVTDITKKQKAVLTVLRSGRFTDEELWKQYEASRIFGTLRGQPIEALPEQSVSGLRTRRSELRHRGLVRDSGVKRRLASGRMAVVWEAPDGQ